MSLIIEREFRGVDVVFELTNSGEVILRTDKMDMTEGMESELALAELGFEEPRWFRQYKGEINHPVLMLVTDDVMSHGLFELWAVSVIERVMKITGAFRKSEYAPRFQNALADAQDIAIKNIGAEQSEIADEDEEEDVCLSGGCYDDDLDSEVEGVDRDDSRMESWYKGEEEHVYGMRKEMREESGLREVDRIEDLETDARQVWDLVESSHIEYDTVGLLVWSIDIFKDNKAQKFGAGAHHTIDLYHNFMNRVVDLVKRYSVSSRQEYAVSAFQQWAVGRAVALVEAGVED